MRIGLGGAQFGMDYGVSSRTGKTPPEEIEKILVTAAANGIEVLDTAACYGDSEAALGRVLPPGAGFRIVTKTPGFAGRTVTAAAADELEQTFRRSLEKLRRSSVYGLLAHRADDLLGQGGELLMGRMKALRAAGLVAKIGASVYSAEQIDGLLARWDFDLIQLPVNLLDQRLVRGGHLARLKARGVEIHARSAFLQGLLLMSPEQLPAYFGPIRPHLEACRRSFAAAGASPLAAALAFVLGLEEVDAVICGVNDHRQLEELCVAAGAGAAVADFGRFALDDERFINPANWKLQ